MRKFAYELAEGDTLEIHARDWVTVLTVDRRDNAWISNGVVFFTATNGNRTAWIGTNFSGLGLDFPRVRD